jgi:hypothetical protein
VRLFFLLLVALGAPLAVAQTPPIARDAARSTVRGVVMDSLAMAPLAGATVQLVAADSTSQYGRTEIADAQGQFAFADVPAGRYTVGFYHPMLDSLGLEPMLRALAVGSQSVVRADLAIPTPARFRGAVCGTSAEQQAGAIVVGFIRDARTKAPAAGVSVVGEWLEMSISTTGIGRRVVRRVATTRANGWYALCNTPSPGIMALRATRGADSTDVVEVQVPATGFLRHELFLGAARTVAIGDSLRGADSVALPPRRIHVGDGFLSGTVVSADNGRPLANAQVSVVNGPQTRANERGQWALTNAPHGSRAIDVRAVGYYPERRTVDVVDSAPALRVALVTFKSVLDTMKVIANYDRYSRLAGFRERSRTGTGRYITADDLARRQPTVLTDIFRSVPGLFLDGYDMDATIMMRGSVEEQCTPAIYVNDHLMSGLSASSIDMLVHPKEVIGIEIYSSTTVPPQFQPGLSGCGSIVIWSK